jgi:hypothetical protein
MTWRMTLTPIVDPAQVRFMAGKTCDTRRRAGSRAGTHIVNCYGIGRIAGGSAVAQLVNQSGTKRVGSPQKSKFTWPKCLGTSPSPNLTGSCSFQLPGTAQKSPGT